MSAIRQEDINHIAGQIASQAVERHGNALIETVAGSEQLVKVAKQYMNCDSSITQGRLFEIIETTKFNVNAAKAGSLLRAITTDQLGMPHHEADIFIKNASGDVLREVQAKSGERASNIANYIRKEKYSGMDRLININHKQRVDGLMENRISKGGIYTEQYKDAQANLKGQLEHENISSGGTTYKETKYAADNAESYARQSNYAELITGAKNAMLSGALAGAFVGGTVNVASSIYKRDFSIKETGKVVVNNASRGAVISGISYGLKYIGKENPIIKGNVVSAMASSAVSMTEITYKFITGKISTDEFVEQLGSNSVSCFSGIVMTAAGGMLFGPIGAAVAGTVSLMAMKQLYQVFINARNDLKLTREARIQAEILSGILIKQVKDEEQLLVSYYNEYKESLKTLRGVIDLAIKDDQFSEQAIVSLATGLNIEIKYESKEKFKTFMLGDEDLEL